MAQIRSHFKNKYVKILTCFFAIALILFTSFSNFFIPIFAADEPSDGEFLGHYIHDNTFMEGFLSYTSIYPYPQDYYFDFYYLEGETRINCIGFQIAKTSYAGGARYYLNFIKEDGTTVMCFYSASNNSAIWGWGSDYVRSIYVLTSPPSNMPKFLNSWIYVDEGPDYGDLVLGQTRVFKHNPAPVANMLVSDQFSFTDAYGNTYNEFIAANMLTDGNPLLYIKYGDVYVYGSIDQSLVLLRTWNQPYYRQITFNELPDDQATINYILANSSPVSEPDEPLDPDDPYNAGYNVGYDVGYQAGLQQGYDNGYNAGFADGDYQNGYQAGYEKGTSNTFVKSLFVNFFTGIVEAIDSIVLYEEDGITFTMWDIMVALIVISIIITILVVYRGG